MTRVRQRSARGPRTARIVFAAGSLQTEKLEARFSDCRRLRLVSVLVGREVQRLTVIERPETWLKARMAQVRTAYLVLGLIEVTPVTRRWRSELVKWAFTEVV